MGKGSSPKKIAEKNRDLDIEIAFLEGILASDPQYIEAWEAIALDYSERGLYKKGLEADLHITALKPREPLAQYNLGCSYSLMHQEEKAADTLELAIVLGYRDFDFLLQDPDLINLQKHPAWLKIQLLIQSARKKTKRREKK